MRNNKAAHGKKGKLIVILGPTASGKSEFAVKLAKKLKGEIISADSRQVYKGLDIGTAKVKGEWVGGRFIFKGIPHYCIDFVSPKKVFSVRDFIKFAEEAITSIYRSGKIPFVVGGTAFYISAFVDGIILPEVPPNVKLRKKLSNYSTNQLFNYLTKLDPERAKTIDQKNKRRLIRALEIVAAIEKVPPLSTSDVDRRKKYTSNFIGLKTAPEKLKKRIKKRTRDMIRRGLTREVSSLHRSGLSWKRIYEFGFEYKYPALYLQKKISKTEMISSINKESIDYTRRQMLWWKNDKRIHWISTAPVSRN
ncbi:tRNA (adenosine(37)-N6)-dimethylallyltransferase MiaA [Candidatus Giovannonibacteria bacterium]|nr:tRNA (adenosine(37)-N6)-dimethylallyltransferase MiaA [Candidatus Giovannonibacteria bacterium]